MTEPQPDPLAVFLTVAECHILEAAKRSTEGAGESLISSGIYYAPRLFAAVQGVLERHAAWEIRDGDFGEGPVMYHVCKECCAAGGGGQSEECAANHALPCWPCGTVQDLVRALLGEGETDGH